MNIGERVSGRYKILGKIGSGGMANVYLAHDLILEREVAVKMMSLNFQNDGDSLRRFQREALSTTELIHPNIVNIYDVGEGDHPYIVMEYVDGMDLKEYIKENHPIPYNKVIDIMSQLLSGIDYAHSNGVIHRDIKPHNILIDKEGNVKITDFGIAVALSQNSITQTNSLLGSVQYISPEQARGNLVTKQSDIYSLGIVLYEMLTASVPFEGESAVSIALKHFQSPIPSLRDFDSRIPQPLENVVLKATAKEPNDRYLTVNDMKEDLLTSLSPQRRDEPRFEPADINDENTLVLKGPLIASADESNAEAPIDETVIIKNKTEPEPTQQTKKKKPWWLLFPVLVLAAFLIWYLSRPSEVVVPDELIGMTYDEAVEFLEENNLLLGETIERVNDEVEEGLVFDSTPDIGSTVREGSEVDLYISLGEAPFEIEDYVGENFEEIRAELTELGFKVERETDTDDTIPEGHIISQSIDEGEEVLISETTITFTVSEGKPFILLDDLTNYSRRGVEDYANNHDLRVEFEESSSEEVPLGQVISQTPAARTPLYAGDTFTVVISTGPVEINTVEFSVDIVIPYVERFAGNNEAQQNNDADSDAETENGNDEGSEPENETSEPILLPNEIQIYIDDYNRDIEDVAYAFLIEEDTEYTLNFIVEEGSRASYRVTHSDGTLIEEATVSPSTD